MRSIHRPILMMLTLAVIATTGLAMRAAPVPTSPGSTEGAPPTAMSLDALSFITGSWRADMDGRVIEETFSTPAAGTIMGVFRWMDEGVTQFTEHLVIERRDDGIHLFVRHFHPGAEPWESEKDGALAFKLEQIDTNRAVFTAPNREFPRHVTYHRTHPDHLTVRLDGTREDGTPREMVFNFRSLPMTTATDMLTEAGQSMGYNGGLTISFGVKDLKASMDWYQNVLGFKLLYHVEEIAWCELSSSVAKVNIGLSQVENPTAGGPTPTFGVKDIDHARAQLESKGVRFDGETQEYPGMVRLATFFDPDGNSLMLFQSLSDEMP